MIEIGIPALRIISVSFLILPAAMIIGYVISGLGNRMVNMVSTAIRQLVLLVPWVFLLGRLGGIKNVWFAFWIAELAAFIFAVFGLRKEMRKMNIHPGA